MFSDASEASGTSQLDPGVAISVQGVSKMYRIYDRPVDRLKQMLMGGVTGQSFGREYWAIKDIDLTVACGEAVGIIGRNGSGKSTLLQCIAGVLAPTVGTVTTRGRVAALLELGSGFNPDYSGRDNIFLSAAILGLSVQETAGRLGEILSFADIGDFIDQPVKTYSSGMAVRLAFAIQVALRPDVLIVDEALSVGDVFFQIKCHERMERLIQDGCSILLVTHDPGMVRKYCSRAVVLERGRAVFSGEPKDALLEYAKLGSSTAPHPRTPAAQPVPMPVAAPGRVIPHRPKEHSPGSIELIQLEILGPDGHPAQSIRSGEPLVIEARFRVLQRLEMPIVTVAITNAANILVHSKNTIHEKVSTPPAMLAGQVLSFRKEIVLNVAPGDYIISIGLTTIDSLIYGTAREAGIESPIYDNRRLIFGADVGPVFVSQRDDFGGGFGGICDLQTNTALKLTN